MTRSGLCLALALALVGGCRREAPPGPPGEPAGPAPSPISAADALDLLDERDPLPLLPRMASHQKRDMREHLVAVQEIVAGLAAGDFAAVETAAGRMGSSEDTEQRCTHMGAGAPGFTEQALGFHRAADRIAAAARERDAGRVLAELGATLETCTSCHATWKQQLVDEATWRRRAAAATP